MRNGCVARTEQSKSWCKFFRHFHWSELQMMLKPRETEERPKIKFILHCQPPPDKTFRLNSTWWRWYEHHFLPGVYKHLLNYLYRTFCTFEQNRMYACVLCITKLAAKIIRKCFLVLCADSNNKCTFRAWWLVGWKKSLRVSSLLEKDQQKSLAQNFIQTFHLSEI